jgi:predicted DNA-binding protein with PD1-like motif
MGDIALKGEETEVHAHVVAGGPDGSTKGGHIMEAHVRPTLEVMLTESPSHLRRQVDEASGLALINIYLMRLTRHKINHFILHKWEG